MSEQGDDLFSSIGSHDNSQNDEVDRVIRLHYDDCHLFNQALMPFQRQRDLHTKLSHTNTDNHSFPSKPNLVFVSISRVHISCSRSLYTRSLDIAFVSPLTVPKRTSIAKLSQKGVRRTPQSRPDQGRTCSRIDAR